METALKIQRDIKNNTQDLQNYMLDLNNWEEEMKRKELALNNEKPHECEIPPPRNKIKRSTSSGEKSDSEKPKKISAYDYRAWDKFDVDKACADLDQENDGESKEIKDEDERKKEEDSSDDEEVAQSGEENKNLSLIDEAFYEKEMGNQFVKKEQWEDAIKCYTNAINLDPKNAVYYANRSLCFLKMKNFKSAEVDATIALQLDRNYVKAYQRRAFARLAMGQLKEARTDYEEVLRIEPKNALARVEINKIDDKLSKDEKKLNPPQEKKTFNPKEIFKNVEGKDKSTKPGGSSKNKPGVEKKSETVSPSGELKSKSVKITDKEQEQGLKKVKESVDRGDGDKETVIESSVSKPSVFKPLPEWCEIVQPIIVPPHKRSKKPLRRIEIVEVDEDEDYDTLPKAKTSPVNTDNKKEETVTIKPKDEPSAHERLTFDVPSTSIQFQKCWKILKKYPDEAYSYLKKIPAKELPQIFENSLESDLFSELIAFLADDKVIEDKEFVNDFLLGLSNVKRFSSLILFMSGADRTCVKKCIEAVGKIKSKEEISELYRLYEI